MKCHATLSIYSRDATELDHVRHRLGVEPSRASERSGVHALHYSSKGRFLSTQVDAHVRFVRQELGDVAAALPCEKVRNDLGIYSTLWVYLESGEENAMAVLTPEDLQWLVGFHADLRFDVWQ